MSELHTKNCVSCSQNTTFDAEQAYKNLSQKYIELADIVTAYMSQAGLERTARTNNARDLADLLARIVGGKPVAKGAYPECCLIGRRFTNGSMQWFCTGVLVHPRIVLSAAHCHQPPGSVANVVALNCEDEDQLGDAQIISARRTVVHPNYASSGLHDISVLILRKDATVKPVQIASTDEISAATRTTLVGFGNDDELSTRGFGIKREVEVDITHIRRTPAEDLDAAEEQLDFESDLEFVAGGNGYDSCNGDSGGPAYILVEGVRKVAGLTSRATKTATKPCGEGGIYTRVDKNLDFIQNVAKQSGISLS
jgi:secreted trypsin-like serine protease